MRNILDLQIDDFHAQALAGAHAAQQFMAQAVKARHTLDHPPSVCESRAEYIRPPRAPGSPTGDHSAHAAGGGVKGCASCADTVAPSAAHVYRPLGARVAMCSGVTVMSTRGSVFQRAT